MCYEGQVTVLSSSQSIHNEYWVTSMRFTKNMHLEYWITILGPPQYIYNEYWITGLSLTCTMNSGLLLLCLIQSIYNE